VVLVVTGWSLGGHLVVAIVGHLVVAVVTWWSLCGHFAVTCSPFLSLGGPWWSLEDPCSLFAF
jgi:hypothetical protein